MCRKREKNSKYRRRLFLSGGEEVVKRGLITWRETRADDFVVLP